MTKKFRIPKRIVGFKVPRRLRDSKTLHSVLSNPLGREILAAAVVAAAGAAAKALVDERHAIADAADKTQRKTKRTASIARTALESGARAFSDEISDSVRKLLPVDQPKKAKKKARAWAH